VELRRAILTGAIEPGAVLDQEALASSLGLSTTPVREALRRLEAEGLVGSVAFRKVRVAGLSRRELHELYALREVLDPLAASLAASHASPSQLELTRSLWKTTALDIEKRVAANRAFHRSIYSASGNRVLAELLDGLWDRTDRYRFVFMRHRAAEAVAASAAGSSSGDEDHLAMVEALTRGDGAAVASVMSRHIAGSTRWLDEMPEIWNADGDDSGRGISRREA
jgi:DNA-binding GntR family transcriptional regulator